MLVIVQPIFAPNDGQFEKNIQSIESLLQYLKVYPFPITFITGGWCADEKYWKIIENKITEFSSNIKVTLKKFDNNYGKAHVVNTLYQQHISTLPIDYFLTIDSDMKFDLSCANMFTRLLSLAPAIEDITNKTLGMLSLQQHQGCCHLVKDSWKKLDILNMKILQPDSSQGLAGGAIMVSKKAWSKIGGYRVLNVYGGNDGWYLNDCAVNNFWYGLVEDLFMIHPLEIDQKYALWKKDQILTKLNNGQKIDFVELKNRANDNTFWK